VEEGEGANRDPVHKANKKNHEGRNLKGREEGGGRRRRGFATSTGAKKKKKEPTKFAGESSQRKQLLDLEDWELPKRTKKPSAKL